MKKAKGWLIGLAIFFALGLIGGIIGYIFCEK